MPVSDKQRDLQIIRDRLVRRSHIKNSTGQALSYDLGELITSQTPDGTWDDIQLDSRELGPWGLAEHLYRCHFLAKQALLDPQVSSSKAALAGIRFWLKHQFQNKNWWWNQIGVPISLGYAMLGVQEHLNRDDLKRAENIFTAFKPHDRFTGQNLLWVSKVHLFWAVLNRQTEMASQAMRWMGAELKITSFREGIQNDMSFFQHGPLLYSGGYGAQFIADLSEVMTVSNATSYAWPQHAIELLSQLTLEGTAWMVRDHKFDLGCIGREITRADHTNRAFFRACENFSHIESKDLERFTQIHQQGNFGSHVSGNRYFHIATIMTHHRPKLFISSRLHSPNTYAADMPACGGEGRYAHNMADHSHFFMQDGSEYHNIFPLWDWMKIPGTTAIQNSNSLNSDKLRRFGQTEVLGGCSNGQNGFTTSIFKKDHLKLKKTQFFFEEQMLCLISDVESSEHEQVYTCIDQCHYLSKTAKLPSGPTKLRSGESCQHHNLIYRIIEGEAELSIEKRQGTWNDCGVGSNELMKGEVFQLGFDHRHQTNSEFAYVVQHKDHQGEFQIIKHDSTTHAVAWNLGSNTTGMASFFKPDTLELSPDLKIEIHTPCSLLWELSDETLTLQFTDHQSLERTKHMRFSLSGALKASIAVPYPKPVQQEAKLVMAFAIT